VGIASWIFIGVVFGLVAKLAMPGPAAGGMKLALLIGILGAFTGGLLGTTFSPDGLADVNLYAVGMAAVGAMYPLFVYRCIAMRFDALPSTSDRELYLQAMADDASYSPSQVDGYRLHNMRADAVRPTTEVSANDQGRRA
jgi:uncharacterized membrane protein YeaQ/YmgE (transglycosylase-associated protein family)